MLLVGAPRPGDLQDHGVSRTLCSKTAGRSESIPKCKRNTSVDDGGGPKLRWGHFGPSKHDSMTANYQLITANQSWMYLLHRKNKPLTPSSKCFSLAGSLASHFSLTSGYSQYLNLFLIFSSRTSLQVVASHLRRLDKILGGIPNAHCGTK